MCPWGPLHGAGTRDRPRQCRDTDSVLCCACSHSAWACNAPKAAWTTAYPVIYGQGGVALHERGVLKPEPMREWACSGRDRSWRPLLCSMVQPRLARAEEEHRGGRCTAGDEGGPDTRTVFPSRWALWTPLMSPSYERVISVADVVHTHCHRRPRNLALLPPSPVHTPSGCVQRRRATDPRPRSRQAADAAGGRA